jgi:hypothetical protein
MNRDLWAQTLSKTSCPPWPCPECGKGATALLPNSLIAHETVESRRARGHEVWDPDWISYSFTAWAECTHPGCKQTFAIAGVGGVGPEMDEEGNESWQDYFVPKYVQPMPRIIELPGNCPREVSQELAAAFETFLSHPASCAGRIRVALECLMNHLGVPKKQKKPNGKYFDLSLHARIQVFSKSAPHAGPSLLALKWLGNSGSHVGEVKQSEMLDAFEILEHTLGEIIDQRSKRVALLAKQLAKKHGIKR